MIVFFELISTHTFSNLNQEQGNQGEPREQGKLVWEEPGNHGNQRTKGTSGNQEPGKPGKPREPDEPREPEEPRELDEEPRELGKPKEPVLLVCLGSCGSHWFFQFPWFLLFPMVPCTVKKGGYFYIKHVITTHTRLRYSSAIIVNSS